jgi:predicted nucleic acid-binding protein
MVPQTLMTLVDTNILIFALDIDSEKNSQARQFLSKNATHICIAHQNILEAIRVLTHKSFPKRFEVDDAISKVEIFRKAFKIISPPVRVDEIALSFVKNYKLNGNQIFDAYLAATALSHGINTIATDNEKDFEKIKEIKIINPFK